MSRYKCLNLPPSGDLFLGSHTEGDHDLSAASAPYMLFSQSPWSVGVMNKGESKSKDL